MAKDIYDTFRDIGIIPVVAIEDASKAAALAHALVKGGLPASEVTFRTACAAEAISEMVKADIRHRVPEPYASIYCKQFDDAKQLADFLEYVAKHMRR